MRMNIIKNFVARVVVYCACARACTCESGCLKMAESQSSSARVDSVGKSMSVEVSIFLQSDGNTSSSLWGEGES